MSFEEQVVHGRYRLLARIGRGAASVVWQARDERLDRIVAIKQLRPEPASRHAGETCERAIREARFACRLEHAHAIAVHDVFEESGSMYLVLEYLPSRPLTELLIARGPMPPEEVTRLGHQIASALAAAHAHGIMHLDVSPNNVLVTDDGPAKITDFGVSRRVSEEVPAGEYWVAGTPAYVSPEVASGEPAGFPADVYSLGATLYTALEGAPPFGSSLDSLVLFQRIIEGDFTPPAHRGLLGETVTRMLGPDPATRPTMREVAELFADVRPAEPPGATASRKNRILVSAVAAGLACAGLAAGLTFAGRAVPAPVAAVSVAAGPPATVTTDRTIGVTTTASPALPRPSRTSAPRPASPHAVAADCTASFAVTSSWPGGAQAVVTVHNAGSRRLTGWVVSWQLPAATGIRELWNGTSEVDGTMVTVTDAGWNAVLEPDAATSFGLNQVVDSGVPRIPRLTCRGD